MSIPQSTVSLLSGAGVVGEAYVNDPKRAQSYILNSALASYNVFGRGFSVTSEGNAAAGNAAGALPFAGILITPKQHALLGDSSGTLNPSLALPNYVQADLATMGTYWVALPAAAAIGDLVVYDNTTGILATIAPGADLPVGKSFAFAVVSYKTVSVAGLAVITLTPSLPIPVLA